MLRGRREGMLGMRRRRWVLWARRAGPIHGWRDVGGAERRRSMMERVVDKDELRDERRDVRLDIESVAVR